MYTLTDAELAETILALAAHYDALLTAWAAGTGDTELDRRCNVVGALLYHARAAQSAREEN